jgi:glycosyltransferase involved in cell wall biosynthesis
VVKEIQKENPFVKYIENDKKYGKGYTVKKGVLASQGEYVLVVDADIPINLEKYLDAMFFLLSDEETGAVYTTSLWDKIAFNKRSKIRATVTLSLFFLRKLILKQDISETQLGCKLYKGKLLRESIANLKIHNFMYEIYLTDIILLKKYAIEECSVRIHKFSKESTVTMGAIFASLITFFKYAWSERRGLIKKLNLENDVEFCMNSESLCEEEIEVLELSYELEDAEQRSDEEKFGLSLTEEKISVDKRLYDLNYNLVDEKKEKGFATKKGELIKTIAMIIALTVFFESFVVGSFSLAAKDNKKTGLIPGQLIKNIVHMYNTQRSNPGFGKGHIRDIIRRFKN